MTTRAALQDLVDEAVVHLLLHEGRKPTIEAVQDWLERHDYGRRNNNAIAAQVKSCWDRLPSRLAAHTQLIELEPDVLELVAQLRGKLALQAAAAFDAERERFHAQLQETEALAAARVRDAQLAAEAAASRAGELATQLAQQQALLAEAREATARSERERQAERTALEARLDNLQAALTQEASAGAQLRAQLDSERRAAAEELAAQREAASRLDGERLLEIDRLRTELAAQRKAQQTERTQAEKAREQLSERLEDAVRIQRALDENLASQRAEMTAQTARTQAAELRAGSLEEALTATRALLETRAQHVSELGARLESVEAEQRQLRTRLRRREVLARRLWRVWRRARAHAIKPATPGASGAEA